MKKKWLTGITILMISVGLTACGETAKTTEISDSGSTNTTQKASSNYDNSSLEGIREGIENESIRLHVAEHVAEIVLEQAASAAAEGKQLYARIAAELGRVGHSRAGCAGAVRVAGTPDGHAMTERILYGLYRGALFHAYPDGILFAVEREVEQTLVHTAVHIAYERERLVQLLVRRHSGGSEEPLTVLAYVEVIAPGGKAVGIGRET